MYASVHIENKVTIEEVLGILKDNLLVNEATVTVTEEPPVGYAPLRPLVWLNLEELLHAWVTPSTSRRYIIDGDGNVFTVAVTASVDPMGKSVSTVTAKSVRPYTDEDYSICNTTTRVKDIPAGFFVGDHGYSDARSGGRHLNDTPVGRALSETASDIVAFAKDKEVEPVVHRFFSSPEYCEAKISELLAEESTRRVSGACDLVNHRGAVIGRKVTVSRDMCRTAILKFIVALAGLDTRNDMGTPHGYTKFDDTEPLIWLNALGLNFTKAVYSYVTTPNNEVYLLVAMEDAQLFRVGAPTSTVCAIRIAPRLYNGKKIKPTAVHGNIPISEDMHHSYYGRNIARAVDALLTPIW